MKSRLLILSALFLTFSLSAQIQTPAPSPTVKMETTIGLTDVMVQYSRPGKKGRDLFAADGLVPYGEIWRTGANQATMIAFGDEVMIGLDKEKVPAGEYAILTKPFDGYWEVMFYPYESGSWNSYVEKEPAARVRANTQSTGSEVETFTINVANYSMDGADIVMKWGGTMVAIPVKTNAMETVSATIERVMAGPSMNDYFAAATFLHEGGGDQQKALEYVQKANGMAGDSPRYWMVRREALILADLGMKQEAIEAAKKSKMLAEKAGNADYVRMNEKSLEEWMK